MRVPEICLIRKTAFEQTQTKKKLLRHFSNLPTQDQFRWLHSSTAAENLFISNCAAF